MVIREVAVQTGIAGYEKDLDAAKKNDRIGDKPLVVKGMEAIGRNRANLVVSRSDSDRIREAAMGQTFLNQCRVVLVLD